MKRYEFSLQYPKPLSELELKDLIDIAKSGLFSRYTSSYVIDLEKELAAYYQVKHAITCTSGTGALHGCLVALNFPPGSEVIMTSVADIGIVIPVIYENLVPIFADIGLDTYNIDINSVERCITDKTKAIIAVHLAGNPADLSKLKLLSEQHNLILLEDFSQAHGAMWEGRKIGSYGDMAYGSFQQSKQITCGEGGVILTNDDCLAKRAFIGVDKAWQRDLPLEKRFYEFLAPNLRFNALQAAVLRPQLKRLDSLLCAKRERAKILYDMLSPYSSMIRPQKVLEGAVHSYYSFPLYVASHRFRNMLLDILDKKYNLYCAHGYANPEPLYKCVNALIDPEKYGKQFKYAIHHYPARTCPQAEDLLSRSFLIPFNENFSLDETREIGTRLVEAIKELLHEGENFESSRDYCSEAKV